MILKLNKFRDQKGVTLIGIIIGILAVSLIIGVMIPVLFMIAGSSHTFSKEVGKDYKRFATLPDAGPIGGVCAGLAYHTGSPIWAWRTGAVVATLFTGGAAVIVYSAIWFFAPHMHGVPDDYAERTG